MFKIWEIHQVMVAKMHRSGSRTDVGAIWERSNHQLNATWQIFISETTLNKCWTAWILPTPLAFLLQYQTHGCSGKTCLTSKTLTASDVGCTCLYNNNNNKLNNSSIYVITNSTICHSYICNMLNKDNHEDASIHGDHDNCPSWH